MSRPRVILVAKRTAFRRFVEEEGDPRARSLLKKRDPSVKTWLASHREHSRTIDEVERVLDRVGAKTLILQRAHAAFETSDATLVIAVGGDGTLLAASHNVGSVPILVSTAHRRTASDFFVRRGETTSRATCCKRSTVGSRSVRLTRMTVSLNGRLRSKRVLNEMLPATPRQRRLRVTFCT